jgi:DNA polymerase III delta subunit
MEFKEIAAFQKHIEKLDLDAPDIIVISGSDLAIADSLIDRIRQKVERDVGPAEFIVFSGETGDDERLHLEIFNIPLFSPYRVLLVRQGEELFRTVLASRGSYASYLDDFQRFPGRTLLIIVYSGAPSQKMLKIFHGREAHLATRELYANQVVETIRTAAKRMHLHISEEAIHLMSDRLDPKAGAIEQTLERLKFSLPDAARSAAIGIEEVREVLFPGQGMNSFSLVDALFALDMHSIQRELVRYNPASDSLFGALKLILNRADEIRRAAAGVAMGMNDQELIDYLDLKNRPPFIQKKIVSRLKLEINRYTPERLARIYDFLIELQREFRSNAAPHRQVMLFEERILDVFFQAAPT